jgi:CubicO group peptidase (beta-lactamase class C family)
MRLLSALLLSVALCAAQDIGRMDEVVRSFADKKQFMGTVLVAKGDQVLFSKGYGSANLEWDIPNTPNTKFRLGSVTKQFTAASILLMEEQGKLSIDDLVSKHIGDAPAAWSGITIRHVLSHTSGIPSFTGFPTYRELQKKPHTAEQLVALFRDKPLDFQPGEKWNYSNSGYVLLGYLVERISGQTYAEFLKQNVFNKLDMNDSGVDSNSAVIPRRASGYSPAGMGIENAGYIHMSVPHGAGALYSTTEDLLRWERGLFGGRLLKPESVAKMTTVVKNDYALGVSVNANNGHKRISHGGGIEGFNTMLAYYPDDQVTVAVLGNLNGPAPDRIADMMGKLALGFKVVLPTERTEVKVPRETLALYVGEYTLNPKVTMTMTLDGHQLMTQLTGQGKIPVYAESPTKFFLKVVDAQLEFQKDADGKVVGAIMYQNGRETKVVRK